MRLITFIIFGILQSCTVWGAAPFAEFEYWAEKNDLTSSTVTEIKKSWSSYFPELVQGGHKKLSHPEKSIWLRLSHQGKHDDSMIVISTSHVTKVDYYHFRDGVQVDQAIGGPLAGTENINVLSSVPVFYLRSADTEKTLDEVYLRVASLSADEISIAVKGYNSVIQELEISRALVYFFLGAILIVFVYQLALYAGLRERFIFYYLAMHLFFVLARLSFSGFFDYFWPVDSVLRPINFGFVFAGFSGVFVSLFSLSFFHFRSRKIQWMFRVTFVCQSMMIALGVLQTLDSYHYAGWIFKVYKTAGSIAVLLNIVAIVYAAVKKLPYSKFILVSWMPIAVFFILNLNQIIPMQTAYARQLILIPMFLELLMMSLVMSKKARELNYQVGQNHSLKKILRLVSHDLANQLFVIEAHSEILCQSTDQKVLHSSMRIQKALGRSKSLLDSVLGWVFVQDGRLSLDIAPVDLKQVLFDSLDTFEERARAKDVEIQAPWLLKDEKALILAEVNSLQNQVISNGISNAVKFTPRGGKVLVDVSVKPHEIEVTIQDNGSGMPKEVSEAINSGKWVESQPGTENEVGTGFGTSLMNSYMHEYGGSLRLESDTSGPRKGTTLHLTFKRAA